MSGKRKGFVSAGRHGAKKQKLRSLSKEIVSATAAARAHQQRVQARALALNNKKAGKRENRARIPYNRHQQILTVGEGNFSFTRALVEHFQQQPQAPEHSARSSSATADDDDDDEPSAKGKEKGGKARRDGQFDPSVHTPFLPPGSIFTNPACRVVATCYDSFRDLTFKYPDVTSHLAWLSARSIPIYSGVDALHFEQARRRLVTAAMIEGARMEEAQGGAERERARKRRREAEDAQEEYAHAQDEEEDTPSAAAAHSPLLFPPFITRKALHSIQAEAENKLHGSQRTKWKAKRAKDQEEFKAAVLDLAEGSQLNSDGGPKKAQQAARPPSAAVLRMKERAALTDSHLSQLNARPRTRFHRVIFNFPHTGCGIKDTERNNAHHRDFLEAFFRNVVSNRLVYPQEQFGEIHVTLKKGEPYKSWDIIRLAKRVPGLRFKTSVEFYPHLYRGYEHRRTRGFEDRAIDLATGAAVTANADIHGGAMTYIFTRERTAMDDEEAKFDADWIAKFGVQSEADEVRRQLLAECDRIYKETRAKHGELGDDLPPQPSEEFDEEDAADEDNGDADADEEQGEDDAEAAADESMEEAADEDEEQPEEEESAPEEPATAGDGASEAEEEEQKPAVIMPNFAAAFRQHFATAALKQPIKAAAPTKSKSHAGPPAKKARR